MIEWIYSKEIDDVLGSILLRIPVGNNKAVGIIRRSDECLWGCLVYDTIIIVVDNLMRVWKWNNLTCKQNGFKLCPLERFIDIPIIHELCHAFNEKLTEDQNEKIVLSLTGLIK